MREEEGKEVGFDELIRHNNIDWNLGITFGQIQLSVRLKGRLQGIPPSVP
jgi:hypothetical protein